MVKPKRVINRALLDSIAALPCLVCGGKSDPCHIKSRGAGGADNPENLLPLCRRHHSESHSMNWHRFAGKYPVVYWALKVRGWGFEKRGGVYKLVRLEE